MPPAEAPPPIRQPAPSDDDASKATEIFRRKQLPVPEASTAFSGEESAFDEAPKRRAIWRWLLIPTLIGVAIAYQAWPRDKGPAGPTDPTAGVVRGQLEVRVLSTGRVEPALQAQIRSRVGGVVAQVLVSEGQHVHAGDVLLKLDPIDYRRDLERARALTGEHRASLRLAEQRRSTVEKGLAFKVIPRVEMDTAEAEVALATARLRGARVAELSAADHLRYATVTAPFEGTVIQRNVQPGEVVVPGMSASTEGKPLLVLGDANTLLVRAELNQIDFARVGLGNHAEVTFDALPGHSFEASLMAMPASSTKTAGGAETFPIQLRLTKNGDTHLLKPGMSADVEISVGAKENALLVPIEAISAEKGKRSVEVWSPAKGRFEAREIQTGEHDSERMEVLRGLAEGDRVLAKGARSQPRS
jgi:macrolide-specific efflux system membrane fusion protein